MPIIAKFKGIDIEMRWGDHSPPHFHAKYGEYEALVLINDLEISEGDLPKKQAKKFLSGQKATKKFFSKTGKEPPTWKECTR